MQLYGEDNVSVIKNTKHYILFCKAIPPKLYIRTKCPTTFCSHPPPQLLPP